MKPLDIIESRAQASAFLHQREHHGQEVFLSTDKAAEFVGSPNRAAFRKWAKRAGLTFCYRGRRVVISRRDLEAELHRQAVRGRHGR